eukprot:g16280.t1
MSPVAPLHLQLRPHRLSPSAGTGLAPRLEFRLALQLVSLVPPLYLKRPLPPSAAERLPPRLASLVPPLTILRRCPD